MELAKSLPAYKKVIRVIYSCDTTEQLEGAGKLLQAYARLYRDNTSMSLRTRITAKERVSTASAIIKLKYRDIVD